MALYCAHSSCVNSDSARQSQNEASRSDRRGPAPCGQGEEEDQFGEVTASPNSHNLSGRGIVPIPLYLSSVAAGFPSPADDYLERVLDLHELMIDHPAATFFVRVSGDSMIQANIFDGDLLVIDRAVEAKNRSIVLAILNGEFTVKRLMQEEEKMWLAAENPSYPNIQILSSHDFEVWGVVTYVIHKVK